MPASIRSAPRPTSDARAGASPLALGLVDADAGDDAAHPSRSSARRGRAGGRRRGPPRARRHLQGVPRHRRRGHAAQDRHGQGRVGRVLRRPPRRDVRARRRVGLRQDDDRPARHRARPADVGRDPFRRPGHLALPRARAAPLAARPPAHVPGSVRVARPAHARRADRSSEPLNIQQRRLARRPREARRRAARRGRAAHRSRPGSTRTSSRAASASASASPARSRSTRS